MSNNRAGPLDFVIFPYWSTVRRPRRGDPALPGWKAAFGSVPAVFQFCLQNLARAAKANGIYCDQKSLDSIALDPVKTSEDDWIRLDLVVSGLEAINNDPYFSASTGEPFYESNWFEKHTSISGDSLRQAVSQGKLLRTRGTEGKRLYSLPDAKRIWGDGIMITA